MKGQVLLKRFRTKGISALSVILVLAFASCAEDGNSDINENQSGIIPVPEEGIYNFVDVTRSTGIDFVHNMGDDYLTNVIESVGSGCAFLDYNQNGFLDIYIANGSYHDVISSGERPRTQSTNALYENLGNGRFRNITQQARVGDTGYSMGVTVGDFNNNGYPDIYVSNYGPNVLYRNNGDGTFTDVTERAGVAGNESSAGAVWLDYNNNGLLDLYVANYVEFNPELNLTYAPDGYPGPLNFKGQADILYRNNGDGTFTDVTKDMGLYNPAGRAMGVGAIDIDGNGYPDIYVANDAMANYFFSNDEGNGFRDLATRAGLAFNRGGEATASMGVSFADFTGDGLLDLFVSDDSYNSLYQNQGGGLFSDVSFPSGIAIASGQHVGWSAAFIDYNNNGFKDIYLVNGELKHLHGQEDQLFENNGNGTFRDVTSGQGPYFSEAMVGRGGCFGDVDNDGDIDVFIVNLNQEPVLLRNDIGNRNNWLLINLIGTQSNRDGVGATVKVTAGEQTQTDQKTGGGQYLSKNDPRLHFGLGDNDIIDRVEIHWPSGIRQVMENVEVNQILTIEEK
jgi:enediyne biosynthesis protein E4